MSSKKRGPQKSRRANESRAVLGEEALMQVTGGKSAPASQPAPIPTQWVLEVRVQQVKMA